MGIASYPLEEPQNMQNESAETVDVCDWLITMVGDVKVALTVRENDTSEYANGFLHIRIEKERRDYDFLQSNVLYTMRTYREEEVGKPTIPQEVIDRFNRASTQTPTTRMDF